MTMRRFDMRKTFHSDYLQGKTVVVRSICSPSCFTVKFRPAERIYQDVEQIINCRIANLEPNNGKYWTREAVKYFEEIALNRYFSMKILKEIDDIYFINLNDYDLMISIDQYIVDEGYAVYTNFFSQYYPFAS